MKVLYHSDFPKDVLRFAEQRTDGEFRSRYFPARQKTFRRDEYRLA